MFNKTKISSTYLQKNLASLPWLYSNHFSSLEPTKTHTNCPSLVLRKSPFLLHPLDKKPYFPSPGISWKAQKYQVNIIFPSTFLIKRPHFPFPKILKEELFRNHWTWDSMLDKISSYINFFGSKKTLLSISEQLKARTLLYSVNMVFHAKESILLFFLRTEKSSIIIKFRKYWGKIIFLPISCVEKDLLFHINSF